MGRIYDRQSGSNGATLDDLHETMLGMRNLLMQLVDAQAASVPASSSPSSVGTSVRSKVPLAPSAGPPGDDTAVQTFRISLDLRDAMLAHCRARGITVAVFLDEVIGDALERLSD